MELEVLLLKNLTQQDIFWMLKACEGHYGGMRPVHLVEDYKKGVLRFWRITGGAEGFMAARVMDHPNGLVEFLVFAVAGKGLYKQARELERLVIEASKEYGAHIISAQTFRTGMMDLFQKRLKWKPQAWFFTKDIGDGSQAIAAE